MKRSKAETLDQQGHVDLIDGIRQLNLQLARYLQDLDDYLVLTHASSHSRELHIKQLWALRASTLSLLSRRTLL